MTELRPWVGFDSLVEGLARLQARAREAAVRSVDEILTLRNWLIGAWIVAYEQEGTDRARYGEGLIDALAAAFKARGVQGLSERNLRNYRQIALTWRRLATRQTLSGGSGAPGRIWQTLSAESLPALPVGGEVLPWQDEAWMLRLRRDLSFSHLLELSRVSDPVARAFYEVQTLAHRWSVRELKRQRDSMLYERVGLSRDREAVLALANEGRLLDTATTNVRDPYVLEFLGLPERRVYSESDLESALVDHLQEFLLELGGDFAFLGRQYRITVGGRHHFIDLLFFHRRAAGGSPGGLDARIPGLTRQAEVGMIRGVIHLSLGALLLLALAGPASAQVPAPAQTQGGGLLLGTAEPGSSQLAPVLASHVHVEVAGVVARTRLTQIFRNPTDRPLEAVYVFPLAAGAAVDGLSLAVGQRAVHGRIVARDEGVEAGRQAALAEGRKTAVLTREGPELFSIAVGAIAPGEEVDVVLDLQQMVAVEGGRFTLRFPMVARSAPGLPDEAASPANTAPRRKASTTGPTSLVNPFDLHVDLYPGIRLGRIESPSHTVRVAEKAGPLYTVDLERAASADRDFVLSWEPVAGVEAQAALYTEEREGERYMLLMVMLPAGAPGLSDVAVRWDDAAAETWPQSIPALKRGGSLVVAARLSPTASLAVISGRRGSAPWEVVLPLSGAAPGQGIAKLWARFKVEALSAGPRDERAAAEARRAITDLGLRYGLVTEHTSLVAEDAVTVDAGGAPQRAWVPLAEPTDIREVGEAGDTLSLTGNPRVARSIQAPIQKPAAAVAVGRKNANQTSVRARTDTTRAHLRRRVHHRRHRRHHRLHRRRHHRVRARVGVVHAVPVGVALTPRARLGAQAQRR